MCILLVAFGNVYNEVMVVFMHEVIACIIDMDCIDNWTLTRVMVYVLLHLFVYACMLL